MPVNKPPREPPTTIDLDMLAERNGMGRNGRRGLIERYVVCVMIWDRRRSVIVGREAFRNRIPRLTRGPTMYVISSENASLSDLFKATLLESIPAKGLI